MSKRRISLNNAVFTTTISLMLVLLMIGVEITLVLSTQSFVDKMRDEITITAVVHDALDSTLLEGVNKYLSYMPYCKNVRYVSKEEALTEHIKLLGDNPVKYTGYNPLNSSFEITLTAPYVNRDSMEHIAAELRAREEFSEVVYPMEAMEIFDTNMSNFTFIVFIASCVLLMIAWVLISNTVRLHIYSERFIIKTMQLVGATAFVIKAPFVKRSMLMGLVAALLAIFLLFATIYYLNYKFGILLLVFSVKSILLLMSAILLSGLLITMLAAVREVGKYIRMDKNAVYEI